MAGNSPDISDMGEGDKKPTLLDRAGAAAAQAAGQVCSSGRYSALGRHGV